MSFIAIPTGAASVTALSSLFQTELTGTPIWVPIVIIVILLLLLWWGLTRGKVEESAAEPHDEHTLHDPHTTHTEEVDETHEHADEHADAVEDAPTPEAEADTRMPAAAINLEPDDLKLIEGIGPKIAGILADAGITTFVQLAETDVETLNKIVREDAGITIAHPGSWPQQARLAADGRLDDLRALQDTLKGGRHQ